MTKKFWLIFFPVLFLACVNIAGAQNLTYMQYPALAGSLASYMVDFRCGSGSVLYNLSCNGGPRVWSDPLKWRKCDWGSNGIDHYQCSDSWLDQNGLIYQSWSYAPWGPLIDSNGDGGQRVRVDSYVASFDATHAAGSTQYLVGLGCGGDGWLIADTRLGLPYDSFIGRIARLAIASSPNQCPPLGAAWTQWLVSTVSVPFRGMFTGTGPLFTLVSEHYDMPTAAASVNMERFFFSPNSFGWWRWESWCQSANGACSGQGADLDQRCPQLGTPWNGRPYAAIPGWILRDCRNLTNLISWDGVFTPDNFGIHAIGE